jgi:hypothetical protein
VAAGSRQKWVEAAPSTSARVRPTSRNIRSSKVCKTASNYRRQWNEKTRSWSEGEYKDWTNHGCDALRTFAAGYEEPRSPGPRKDSLGRYHGGNASGPSQWVA